MGTLPVVGAILGWMGQTGTDPEDLVQQVDRWQQTGVGSSDATVGQEAQRQILVPGLGLSRGRRSLTSRGPSILGRADR